MQATDPALRLADWVLIGCSLFLGIAALLAPWVAEWLKRRFYAPVINVRFSLRTPDCHITRSDLTIGDQFVSREEVFVYRILVENRGRSQAKRCEAVIEGIDRADASGQFITFPRFTPTSIEWGAGYREFLDINPHRHFFCDLAYVYSPNHQDEFRRLGSFQNWPGLDPSQLGVTLRPIQHFYSQPNHLLPGRYRLHLAIFSENAKVVRTLIEVAWSGNWRTTEEAMFQECVVHQLS